MKFVVRPELPTAALRSSQATLAAVDNSAPLATRRSPLKTRGNVVQTTGATSIDTTCVAAVQRERVFATNEEFLSIAYDRKCGAFGPNQNLRPTIKTPANG